MTTYGSAETAGGCIYSGRALPGVRVELVPEEGMPSVPSAGTELTNEDPAHEDPPAARIWRRATWATPVVPQSISSPLPTAPAGTAPTTTAC